jgi:DNA-binding transcriptional ArsR family regulator
MASVDSPEAGLRLDNGARTALSLEHVLRTCGPFGNGGEPPTDAAIFERLEAFGRAYWRIERRTEREFARQNWVEWLQRQTLPGLQQAWRVVREAIKAGEDVSFPVPSLGLDVQKGFSPVPITEFLAVGAEDEEAADWIVPGLFARDATTVVAGAPKVGKTTFLAHAAVAVAGGYGFLDRPTRQCAVLWIDLERPARLTRALFRDLGAEGLPIHIFSETGAKPQPAAIAAHIRAHDIGFVVIDSLSKFWDVEDENDARQVELAITPIAYLARTTHVALPLIHHNRKSGGEDGEELRGSSAVLQNVEILLSLKRHKSAGDTARLLEGTANYDATPRRLVVQYDEGLYRAMGTPADVAEGSNREAVLGALTNKPQTVEQLAEGTGVGRKTVSRSLSALHAEGIAHREGDGKKGSPFRFTRNDTGGQEFVSGQPNPGPGTGTEKRGDRP